MGSCDIDAIQLWLANRVRLLPGIEQLFLAKLVEMALQRKVCVLPQYRMQLYCDKFKKVN